VDSATNNWLRLAAYELETARAMVAAERTLYVVIACQQACDKAIKAVISQHTSTVPPRSHDLVILARVAALELSEPHAELLTYLNQSLMVVRYPTDLEEAERAFPLQAVEPLVPKTEAFLTWLQSLVG
jgi:HEPN domain-containing protein